MSDWKDLSQSSIKGVHQGLLERREVYPIDFIFQVRKASLAKGKTFGYFNQLSIRLNSHTLNTFAEKGCKCVQDNCGLTGAYFALERTYNTRGLSHRWKFVLYAVNEDNEEVLMTRDHIIPKSLGGGNSLDNHNPMCVICNRKKSNRVEETSSNGKPNEDQSEDHVSWRGRRSFW